MAAGPALDGTVDPHGAPVGAAGGIDCDAPAIENDAAADAGHRDAWARHAEPGIAHLDRALERGPGRLAGHADVERGGPGDGRRNERARNREIDAPGEREVHDRVRAAQIDAAADRDRLTAGLPRRRLEHQPSVLQPQARRALFPERHAGHAQAGGGDHGGPARRRDAQRRRVQLDRGTKLSLDSVAGGGRQPRRERVLVDRCDRRLEMEAVSRRLSCRGRHSRVWRKPPGLRFGQPLPEQPEWHRASRLGRGSRPCTARFNEVNPFVPEHDMSGQVRHRAE